MRKHNINLNISKMVQSERFVNRAYKRMETHINVEPTHITNKVQRDKVVNNGSKKSTKVNVVANIENRMTLNQA